METGLIGENKTREIQPDDCQMCVMDLTGDTRTIWSKDNPTEVENARKTFNDLTAKGYVAYCVKKDGTPGKKMKEFDQNAERMILRPVVAGG